MADIAKTFDGDLLAGDLALAGGGLAEDAGLRTAVINSLFSDARASEEEAAHAGVADRRGWWGDLLAAVPGDRFGSTLWTLTREKQTQATLNRARTIADAALAWLVEDALAVSVSVETSYPRRGVLGIDVTIQLRSGSVAEMHFAMPLGAS